MISCLFPILMLKLTSGQTSSLIKNKEILLFALLLPYSIGPELHGTTTVISGRSGKKLKKHHLLFSNVIS